ncbi:GMC oxidoreductase [Amnibacterium flavum]|uniref:Pyranose oxidase n=1 Tax=Amnibacterium flavum TaxID=2173173 RepID=A0A2V1HVA5_9MICO|nr:GMC oxidoreductase [Amnibacterium flavum]PVZ94054.1 pyranose oxidase [Amnibacterium flavum]
MNNSTSRPVSHVDVLIVGSGPAGSTYARTIGDAVPSVRMLMVEVGPELPGVRGNHTQNMPDEERVAAQLLTQGPDAGIERAAAMSDVADGIDPSVEFRQTILPGLFFAGRRVVREGEVGLPAASMSSGVGGMGIHWGTSCPRPNQSERIPFIPSEELDAALDAAEELLGVTKLTEAGGVTGALRDAVAEVFDGPGLTPTMFMPTATQVTENGVTFSGTGRILGTLEDRVPGFELRSETLARRVLVEDGRAVGVELEDRRTSEVYRVSASHVIVCADGLRTPQLLFASGIRPRALGHHLNEHFQVGSFFLLNEEFDPARFEETSTLASVIVPFSDTRPMQGGVISLAGSPYRLPFADDLAQSNLGVMAWYGAKDIRFEDAVEFSETEKDFYGMPAMDIRYSHTARDLETIEGLRENSIRAAARVGTLMEEPQLAAGGSSLHYQGTVRMGPSDDGSSVCDPLLRVWGVENLQVGGNGVIPTSTAANPTLTTVALAIRAARALADDLVSASSEAVSA